MKFICLAFFCFLYPSLVWAAERPVEDRITNLPSVNFELRFEQYSGYLDVGENNSYHYWFFESQTNVAADPLFLFLNGGPGCSSLAALFTECGPFRIKESGNMLVENPYSWNKIANIIFLESPAGAGFSYSSADPILNDDQNAIFHYRALEAFYEKFPEFKKRALYLIGQSYAAIYVTTLAREILNNPDTFPGKLEGIAIGNGAVSYPNLFNARLYYNYYHGLIDEKQFNGVLERCCADPMKDKCDVYSWYMDNSTEGCSGWVKEAIDASAKGRDPYNIHFECYLPNPDYIDDEECGIPFGYITKHYLDREDVRGAMHIPIDMFNGQSFQACSDAIVAKYERQYDDLTNITKELLETGKIRVLIFNGDWDSVCNFLGAQWFVDGLNLKMISDRAPIYFAGISQPNVGYQQSYENLDYLIIRGAGHYVPADRPREALQILANFLRWNRNYSIPDQIDTTLAPLISGPTDASCTFSIKWSIVLLFAILSLVLKNH